MFNLRCAREQRFEIAIFIDQLRCGFNADTRHSGNIINTIASQGLNINDLVGRDAKFFENFINADTTIFHRVEHGDTITNELHEILVRCNNGGRRASFLRKAAIGSDEVVGLITFLLNTGQIKCFDGFADQRKLWAQFFWRLFALRLILIIESIAECF